MAPVAGAWVHSAAVRQLRNDPRIGLPPKARVVGVVAEEVGGTRGLGISSDYAEMLGDAQGDVRRSFNEVIEQLVAAA